MAAYQKKFVTPYHTFIAKREESKLAAAEQAKSAAQAKAAEDAKVAAEKARLRLAAAEQAKAGEQAALVEKQRLAEDKAKAVEEIRTAPSESAQPKADQPANAVVASLPPPDAKAERAVPQDLPRLLQSELKRVGCKTGDVDSEWNAAARRALSSFNENAGTKFDVKLASIDALDAVRARTDRVCPSEKRPERAAPKVTERERRPAAAGRRGGKCFVYNGSSFCE